MSFSYKSHFEDAVQALRQEGRYRVFADLKRIRGRFPQATWTGPQGEKEITVWCSNDYLNMGQHPKVLAAYLGEDIDGEGGQAHAS